MVQQPQPSRTQKFLSRVLSSSSRYDEDMKSVISQHLISLKEANPFMVLGTKKFISDKRKPPILLQARLNIPMVYQNVTYYLPVAFWLTELYPRYAPLVCVYPTPDMVRKRDHPFVNPHGFVTIDYLQNWVYPTCNLVDLCPKLSEAFALDPPLYSKARPDPPNPHYFNTSPSVKSSNSEQPKPSSSSTLGEGDRISDRVFALVEECKKQREALMSASPLVQDGLRMTDGEGLEQHLDKVLKIANVLTGAAVEAVDPVYVLSKQTLDVLLKQMLECTAYDLAITDVTHRLADGVLQEETIPFDVYFKLVRSLSQLQFMHRAKAIKVHATLTTMRDRHVV